jgi:hypothetical protein
LNSDVVAIVIAPYLTPKIILYGANY